MYACHYQSRACGFIKTCLYRPSRRQYSGSYSYSLSCIFKAPLTPALSHIYAFPRSGTLIRSLALAHSSTYICSRDPARLSFSALLNFSNFPCRPSANRRFRTSRLPKYLSVSANHSTATATRCNCIPILSIFVSGNAKKSPLQRYFVRKKSITDFFIKLWSLRIVLKTSVPGVILHCKTQNLKFYRIQKMHFKWYSRPDFVLVCGTNSFTFIFN